MAGEFAAYRVFYLVLKERRWKRFFTFMIKIYC